MSTQDSRVALEFNYPADLVRIERIQWNGMKVLHKVFTNRIGDQIGELDRKLRTVPPEELKLVQGKIAGLELALSLITKTEK